MPNITVDSSLFFERNLGFISDTEQAQLTNSTVAIAGAGGDGGMLALQLARMGVGSLRLADPDPFEAENINRQAACTINTIGVNKAEAVGEYVNSINPNIKIDLFTEGIHQSNVDQFVQGADLVIDETEFTIQSLGVMLARSARKHAVPNLMAMNIGFGATVTSFLPDTKTFEDFLGLDSTATIDEITKADISLSRWLPLIPSYADINTFKKVASGEKSAPSVAPGVAIAAGMAAVQSLLHLVGKDNNRPEPIVAPHVLSIDAYTGQSKVIKHPIISHYRTLATMITRNILKKNPKTSY